MKPTHLKIWLLATLALTNGFLAAAQSNSVPGPSAYSDFSRFITDRNIFDPNRYPHSSGARPAAYKPRVSRSAPAFTLVGTMSYEKGVFAFFDGNNPDLRKALTQSGEIAGYTVCEITPTGVKLQSADKKQTVEMKIGDIMRQEGTDWLPAGNGALPAETTAGDGPAADSSAPASASALA